MAVATRTRRQAAESSRRPRVIDPGKIDQARAVVNRDQDAVLLWAARFDLLSDPNRLRLLMAIHAAPEICVTDLARAAAMSETAVSQALRLLRSQRWVRTRREGRMVLYTLDDHTVHELLHMLGAGHRDADG